MARPKATADDKAQKAAIRALKEPLAARTEYSPWFFLPNEWQVQMDLSKLHQPPPAIPKWPQKTMTMTMIPAGIVKDRPHDWDDGGYWIKFNYTTAFLKFQVLHHGYRWRIRAENR
ncbi:hypothetical protein Aspvir_004139 [Aspergillus viridinutans]|uniref:Uncharacterized protein n=1 Tax=Aspergillus viridinutans TaxID=75553 RepID=A0A9P3BUG2_ASPVI|nr:uncharacterized protein Aspvir_004139 [Aspergillus viridinutans]GIK00121.1 hypothetical protein Aspvir_004139 [Aspergillus viridinutans]